MPGGYNFNSYYAFSRGDSTDEATVKAVPLAGLDYALLEASAFPIWYAIWPVVTSAALATITAAPIAATGSNTRVYKLPTNAAGFGAVFEGMPCEIRASDNTTVHATGIVKSVNKYAQTSQLGPMTYHTQYNPDGTPTFSITVVTSGVGTGIVSGDKIWPLTPAVGSGTLLPLTVGVEGHTVRLPGWAVSNGAIAFISGATGTAVLTISSLIESS